MADEIITYEILYDLLRREKSNQELQVIEKNFFEKVIKYLSEKESILQSQQQKSSRFASTEIQKTTKQLENINKILKELYDRRETKIIQLAIFSSKTKEKPNLSILLPEESEFFNSIIEVLDKYREDILFNLLNGKAPDITKIVKIEEPKQLKSENKEKENTLIRFNENIPKFMGEDLSVYGPFKQEDMEKKKKIIANILVSKGSAKEV